MRPKSKALDEQQREFWGALNNYIRENEGFTVSEPHTPLIRFECRAGSDLPQLLRAKGYDVNSAGTNERLMPTSNIVKQYGGVTAITAQNIVPTIVEVYIFRLPFG
jgi:hypothetical protein